jgi:hypothetical protein
MSRREVNVASITRGELRYGMPHIDFTSDASVRSSCDFRLIPYGRARIQYGLKEWEVTRIEAAGDTLHSDHFAREFAVFNRLSCEMTRFAFCAVGRDGRAIRAPWAVQRPRRWAAERVRRPAQWFPTPYLGFRVADAADVFRRIMSARPIGRTVPCKKCSGHVDVEVFVARADALRLRCLDGGDWTANCPICRAPQKWHVADIVPTKFEFHVPISFMNHFCRAAAGGVPLATVAPTTYCGPTTFQPQRDWPNLPDARSRQLDLIPHRLLNRLTGTRSFVYLPTSARVLATTGQMLAPGRVWAYALSQQPPRWWRGEDSVTQWRSLPKVVGDAGQLSLLQELWLRHQAVMHEDLGEHQFLLPAELASFVGRKIRPIGLFWDFGRSSEFWDERTCSSIFPALRLRNWDYLRHSFTGDVLVDASVADPRFDGRETEPVRVVTSAQAA